MTERYPSYLGGQAHYGFEKDQQLRTDCQVSFKTALSDEHVAEFIETVTLLWLCAAAVKLERSVGGLTRKGVVGDAINQRRCMQVREPCGAEMQ